MLSKIRNFLVFMSEYFQFSRQRGDGRFERGDLGRDPERGRVLRHRTSRQTADTLLRVERVRLRRRSLLRFPRAAAHSRYI